MYERSDKEEEYFKREEMERLRKTRLAQARDLETAERERLKQLHWMRCPKCGLELSELDFKGVTVDACFSCGGMYLDKGEIDKVLQHKEKGWFGSTARFLFGGTKSSGR